MITQAVNRKLAAILSVDVKSYSRFMGEDEEGTIRTPKAYKEVMSNLIQRQRARVVDAPGITFSLNWEAWSMRFVVLLIFRKSLKIEIPSCLRTGGWSLGWV